MKRISARSFNNIPLSVLDLAPVIEGSTPKETFPNSVDLARNVENWGFNRYWLAEHHNMPGIASSATSILIGHIAGATSELRVGAGGIMLPNHATLVIAEQFGTLESLYPGRIDLGLGRAPGTDQATAYALRRTLNQNPEDFPMQVNELENYFSAKPTGYVRAIPGEGLSIPIWLLGSSGFSAQLAAHKGLPFSFASHFAPDYMMQAIKLYRDNFQPSPLLNEPYVMLGVNIIAGETTADAKRLATSQQQQFLSLRRGQPTKLKPPIDSNEADWTEAERATIEQTLHSQTTIVGDQKVVSEKLTTLIEATQADELIINSQIYHHADRLRSYEIVASLMN
ncbi:LLM class flavin-dependent oxidoreductase [Virgibacillus sp. W0430]|uniref:LLM class flavin-dependent oxidoreductase n=1 Tax=Virgibacillus sp. W0430 TaxID=3391580 RepID=UPI003F445434